MLAGGAMAASAMKIMAAGGSGIYGWQSMKAAAKRNNYRRRNGVNLAGEISAIS